MNTDIQQSNALLTYKHCVLNDTDLDSRLLPVRARVIPPDHAGAPPQQLIQRVAVALYRVSVMLCDTTQVGARAGSALHMQVMLLGSTCSNTASVVGSG
jgi:hypothetical protein